MANQKAWMNAKKVEHNQYRNDNEETAYEKYIKAKAEVQKANYERRLADERMKRAQETKEKYRLQAEQNMPKKQDKSLVSRSETNNKGISNTYNDSQAKAMAQRMKAAGIDTSKTTDQINLKRAKELAEEQSHIRQSEEWKRTHNPNNLDRKSRAALETLYKAKNGTYVENGRPVTYVDESRLGGKLTKAYFDLAKLPYKSYNKKELEKQFKEDNNLDEHGFQLYMQYLKEQKDAYANMKMEQDARDFAHKHGRLASATDVIIDLPASFMAMAESIKHMNDADPYSKTNTNSELYRAQNFQNAIEEQRVKDINNTYGSDSLAAKAARLQYNATMSAAKMAAPMMLGGLAGSIAEGYGAGATGIKVASNLASLPSFGASSYSRTLKEGLDRGLSQKQATETAVVAGIAEMGTEVFSIDKLMDIYRGSGTAAARNAFLNWLSAAGIEGSEEVANDFINRVADDAINKDKSEYNVRVRDLMSDGYSEEEAKGIASKEFISQVAYDGLVGALVGGAMGGIGVAKNSIRTNAVANELKSDDYLKIAESLPTEESAYDNKTGFKAANEAISLAQSMAKQVEQGETLNFKDKKKLVHLISEANENIAGKTQAPQQQSSRSENEIVEAISKAGNAQQLTNAYHEALETIPAEQRGTIDRVFANKAYTLNLTQEQISAARLTDAEVREAGYKGNDIGHLTPRQIEVYREGQSEAIKQMKDEATSYAKVTNKATKSGKEYTIQGIEDVTKDDMILQTSDGPVKLSEVELANKGEQLLYNRAAQLESVEAARAYVDNYVPTMTISVYDGIAKNYYTAGQMGLDFNKVPTNSATKDIGVEALRALYNAGKGVEQSAEHKHGKKVTYAKKGSGQVIDSRTQKVSTVNKAFLKKVAEKFSVDIELVDNLAKGDNGQFTAAAGKILLNTESNKVYSTLLHELGEFAQAYNPQAMEDLRVAVLEYALEHNAEGLRENVMDYKNAYDRKGIEEGKTVTEASEELFNDCLVTMFASEDAVREFVTWTVDNRSEQQAKGIIEQLAKIIDDFCKSIRNYLKKNNYALSRTQSEVLRMDEAHAKELRAQILKAFDEAIKNRDALAGNEGNVEMRHSLEVDTEGRKLAPRVKKFFRNSKLVDEQGRLKEMYHGTRYAGFTVFQLAQMDDGASIFLSDNPIVSKSYAGTKDFYEPDRPWSFNELKTVMSFATGGDWQVEKTDSGVRIIELGFIGEEDTVHDFTSVAAAQEYFINEFFNEMDLKSGESAAVYRLYGNATNPLVIDAKGNNWNELDPVVPYATHYYDVEVEESKHDITITYHDEDGNVVTDSVKNYNNSSEMYKKYGITIDEETALFENDYIHIDDIFLDKDGKRVSEYGNTREWSKYARENGYDSVIFNNVIDSGLYGANEERFTPSTVAVVFNPNQVKSIYNQNPTENEDIRYSIDVKPDRVFYTKAGTEVVQNPTSQEYSQMREDILKDRPWLRGTGEPLFRHTYDEQGNEYYWDAMGGLHAQVEPEINKKYNTRTSQQYQWWTKENKDDYPVDYSKRYSIDVDTEGRTLSEGQKKYFEDSVIRDAQGRLKVLFHGTEAEFYVFDPVKFGGKNGVSEGYGIYLSDSREVFETYGAEHGIEAYVNITHPATRYEKTIDTNTLKKLLKAVTESEAKLLVEDGGYDSVEEALPDTWVSNYVYTHDITMEQVYSEVAKLILQQNANDADIVQEVMNGIGVRDYEEAYKFYSILTDSIGIDGLITRWENKEGDDVDVVVAFDSKQVKRTDNQNPTSDKDIRRSIDVDYMDAYKSNDERTMQLMVNAAAMQNGYSTTDLYHGTQRFGFTKMDLQKMDDKQTIFLTSNPLIASTYSGTMQQKKISEAWNGNPFDLSMKELEEQLNNHLPDDGIDRKYVYYNRDKLNALKAQIDKDVAGLGDIINSLENMDEQDKKVVDRLKNTLATFSAEEAVTSPKSQLGVDLWFLATKTLNNTEKGKHLQELEANIRRYNTVNDEMEAIRKYNESPATEIKQPEELILEDMLDGYSVETLNHNSAAVWLRKNAGQGIYKLYAKFGNTFVVDAKGQYWNSLIEWTKNYTDRFNADNTAVVINGDRAELVSNNEVIVDVAATEPFLSQSKEEQHEDLLSRMPKLVYSRAMLGYGNTTRGVTKWAKEHGYDSVVFLNVRDNGGRSHKVSMDELADVYAIFNPNHVKSADPVTYDDNGEVIPPSERFRDSTDDMRYSINVEGRDVDYLGDVLDIAEHRQFMGEIDNYRKGKYFKTKSGDVIVPVNNKLVYTDFNKKDPGISKIITFNVNDGTEVAVAADAIYEAEKGELSYEQAFRFIKGFFGEESVMEYTTSMFGKGEKYDRQAERGKRRSDAYHAEQQQKRRGFSFEDEERHSLEVDTEGRKLTEGQKAFFAESKIVDEQGRLKVMYHGTPTKGFTVFDKNKAKWSGQHGRGFYFSDSKTHSGDYGELYEVYLNIKHPVELGTYDITKEQFRKFVEAVAENEDYGLDNYGYGATVDSVVDSAWGKEDYSLIMDVNASCIGDYVEAVKLFNEVNGTDYDGIVAANETVAFEPNQIKEVTNENPTEDVDIRHSLEIDDDFGYYDLEDLQGTFIDDDGNVLPMGKPVVTAEETIKGLARYLEAANTPLKGHKVNDAALRDIANQLKGEYQSAADTEVIAENLRKLFNYMQTEDNVNYNEVTKLLSEVSRPIIEQSGKVDVAQVEQYQKFVDYVKGLKIALTDAQKKVFDLTPYGSYNNFRKAYFGTLNFTNEGTALDSVWNDLVKQARGYLPLETAEEDMGIALADALTAMKPQAESLYGYDAREASIDLAGRIMGSYYEAEQNAIKNEMLESGTAGAQAKRLIDNAREEMRREVQDLRKASKAEYERRLEDMRGQIKQYQDAYNALAYDKRNLEKKFDTLSNKQAEQLAKAKARQKTRELQAYIDAEEVKKQKNEINKIAVDLLNRATNPTDKKHMPEGMRKPVAEFLTGIDFVSHKARLDSKNTVKWQIRMNDLRKYLKDAQNEDVPDAMAMVIDPDLIDEMDQFISRNSEVNKVSQLKSWELKALHDILSKLRAAVNKSNEMFTNERFNNQAEFNQVAFRELRQQNDQKNVKNFVAKARDFFTKDLEDPVTYFSLMGDTIKTLFDSQLRGFDVRAGHIKQAVKFMKDLQKNREAFYKWSQNTHTFQLREGTIEMTDAQIMSLYKTMQREQAKGHILPSGFKVSRATVNGKTIVQNKPVRVSPSEYLQIVSVLSQQQMEVADQMQAFMAGPCADWGNHTSMQLYGYKKFNEKNYFPIKTDANSRDATTQESTKNVGLWKNKNMSASKELVIGANNAIVIGDIFDVFADHVTAMATYDGMVLPQMDAMRWFNFREIFHGEDENGEIKNTYSMKEEIERLYGPKGTEYFINLMLGINGMEPKARSTPLTKFIGNYKKAAVTAKVRVAIQQPTAIIRAMDEMNGKYISKALATTNFLKYSQKAQDKSMLAWWKAQGYYETYLGKDVKEMMVGKAPVAQFVDDAAGFGAQKADDLTWGALYHAVEYEIEDTTNLKPGTKEFDDAVVKRFEDVVTKTQVVDTMLHRTDIMRSQNELTKLATSFMAEPLKTYNMVLRSVMKVASNPKDKKAIARLIRTLFVYALNSAILTAVTSAWDAFRDDDDKIPYGERFAERYVEEFRDNINPLNMLPYIKDAAEIIEAKLTGEYRYTTDMATEGISKLMTFVEHMYKRIHGERISKTDWGLTLEGLQAIQVLSGQPIYNVVNDINTIHNAITDNWETKQNTSEYGDLNDAIGKGKGIDEEVDKLLAAGKDKSNISSSVSGKYKEAYQEAEGKEKQEIRDNVSQALERAGYTKEEVNKKFDKWDGVETSEYEEYKSDYADMYAALDNNVNVQGEITKLIKSGKDASQVKRQISTYAGKLPVINANTKNRLVKAYMAAGLTQEEASAKVDEIKQKHNN